MLRQIKNALVPEGEAYRRVLSGICRGCYLPLDLRHQFIRYLGIYEREIHDDVRACVHPGDCCYDIGTARGYYAMALGKLTGSEGTVLAFEADPDLSAKLPLTVQKNASVVKAKIVPMPYYVSNVVDDNKRLITIDHVVYELGHCAPNVFKIDVEGAELEVLQGAARAIEEHHPAMVIETHSLELEQQCQAFLTERGYKVQFIDQAKNPLYKESRPREHNRWLAAHWGGK